METINDKNSLTEGVIWKKLLRFFFPILLGMLFQQLYNTVDAIIVGRYVGASALAAVGGSAAVLTNLVIGFFVGLSSGATVIIAQEYGARNDDKLEETLHTAITFAIFVGVAIMIIGYIAAPGTLRLVKNPEDIMKDSTTYIRIYFMGSVPLLMYNLGSGVLQAIGDSRHPLMYLVVSCFTNIVLDYIFVAKLSMGVAGVAVASIIAMCVSTFLVIRKLLTADGPYRLKINRLGIRVRTLKRILRIGVPSGVQSAMYSLSNIIIQTGVNSFGTVIVAAWTATGKLDGLFWVTSNAFGVAICAFVGQCYGAGKIERMKKSVKTCMLMAQGATAFLVVFLLSIARPAYGLILSETEVIDYAVQLMWYFVPFYFVWTVIEILSGTLRGVGDTLRPMIIIILGTCGVRVLWMLVVVPVWHTLFCVSIVYAISWTITVIAFIIYYFKGNWINNGLKTQ